MCKIDKNADKKMYAQKQKKITKNREISIFDNLLTKVTIFDENLDF